MAPSDTLAPSVQLTPIAHILLQLPLLAVATTLLLRGSRGLRWLRVVLLGLGWLLVEVVLHPFVVASTGPLADVPVVPAVAISTLLVAFGAATYEVRTATDARGRAFALTAALTVVFLLAPEAVGLALALTLWVGGTLVLAWEFRRNARAHPGSVLEARLRVLAGALTLLASVALSTFGGPTLIVWVLPMVLGTVTLVLAVAPPPFLRLVVADTRQALRRADRDLAAVGTDGEAGLRGALDGVRWVFGAEAALLVDGDDVVAEMAAPDAAAACRAGRDWLAHRDAGHGPLEGDGLRLAGDGYWIVAAPTGRGILVLVLRQVGVLLTRTDRDQVAAFAERIGLALDRADARRADQRAAESMRAAERMRDDLLSTLSHELRTPLTSIMGFGEVLRDHAAMLSPEQHRDMLGRIVAKGAHLEKIVTSLLDLTAIRGRSEPDRVAVYDLGDLARRAVSRVQDRLGSRVVTIAGDVTGLVHTDGGAVLAILEQLLDNATKYSEDGTAVDVHLEEVDGLLTVVVRDHGVGLHDVDTGVMFDPFVRGGDVLTRETGGVGVGLAIARELSHQLGGDLRALDVDEGASFELTLPRRHRLAARRDETEPRSAVLAEGDPTLLRAKESGSATAVAAASR